jgi:succinyl-CoA synthetase alpha subunit
VSFIAGAAAPERHKMGHAGAIVAGNTGTHASKRSALTEAGAVLVDMPWKIPSTLANLLG